MRNSPTERVSGGRKYKYEIRYYTAVHIEKKLNSYRAKSEHSIFSL